MSIGSTSPAGNVGTVPPWERLLVDEDEIAELIGVSKPIVRRYIAAGLFHRVEMPLRVRRNLYRLADVRAAVESLPLADDELAG